VALKRSDRDPLVGFKQHGVNLNARSGDDQRVANCPFCGGAGKFYVHKIRGTWDCKSCGRSGNPLTFISQWGEETARILSENLGLATKLAKKRGLGVKTLRAWGVGWNGREYTIPVRLGDKLYDLRRYGGKKDYATSGSKLSPGGMLDDRSDAVWLLEGVWDAMALWECLHKKKLRGSVIWMPGANVFPKGAHDLFENKVVYCAYDNDDAGRRGTLRVRDNLSGIARGVQYVHWPEKLPDGYDVRDLYRDKKSLAVQLLTEMLHDVPPGDLTPLPGKGGKGGKGGGGGGGKLDGKGVLPAKVTAAYRKWLYLPDADVLSIMFGAVLANRMEGDPIWLFLVAPPGGSKTELLMSLTDAPLIHTLSAVTPHALISGATTMGSGDPSLIPKLNGKVLIIKDFTAVLSLQAPARDEIFGILRDAYDGRCAKTFGNGITRSYESTFGIISGVTGIIEMHGASSTSLGERFLRYRVHTLSGSSIAAGDRIIDAALSNINKETTMREELREIAAEALNWQPDLKKIPRLNRAVLEKIRKLAQWVAALRGVVHRERYTREVEIRPQAEVGTRIAKQLGRLAIGVAMYHRLGEVDDVSDPYQIITKVARSTVPDRVEDVVRCLYLGGDLEGVHTFFDVSEIATKSRYPPSTVSSVLQDLELLRVTQKDGKGITRGGWRLTNAMRRLMRPLRLYTNEKRWIKGKERERIKRDRYRQSTRVGDRRRDTPKTSRRGRGR